ncbi:methyltransferase domain-containing protein [Oscillatoriales cyanobacterium LEGE 11467]|uniref:Methyltransferase domain-containing protein n=2 Tax=Zarconia TaxID=2992130 RepID=A0A928VWU7_9CYAN|nr:methyltransferase domain-containing protein [Zarconia navalis LEGE 11467]
MKSQLETFNLRRFDFCDFGCSNGSSIRFGMNVLKGRHGFGVDIDAKKVKATQSKGYEAIQSNFCNLSLPDKCVKFTILSHVLEHLPTLDKAEKAIQNAVRISQDFVFIRGPYFDADDYLKSLGLKFYWSDWSGHPLHFSIEHMLQCLEFLKIENYEIYGRNLVENSNHTVIHPISSLKNQHHWNSEQHDRKQFLKFNRSIYQEFFCVIWLSDRAKVDYARSLSNKFLICKKGFLFPILI